MYINVCDKFLFVFMLIIGIFDRLQCMQKDNFKLNNESSIVTKINNTFYNAQHYASTALLCALPYVVDATTQPQPQPQPQILQDSLSPQYIGLIVICGIVCCCAAVCTFYHSPVCIWKNEKDERERLLSENISNAYKAKIEKDTKIALDTVDSNKKMYQPSVVTYVRTGSYLPNNSSSTDDSCSGGGCSDSD